MQDFTMVYGSAMKAGTDNKVENDTTEQLYTLKWSKSQSEFVNYP